MSEMSEMNSTTGTNSTTVTRCKKDGWVKKKLGEVCETFIDGDWIESKDQSDGGIRLIQTGNVGKGIFRDKADNYKYISEETFKGLKCTEVYSGDILISRLPEPIGRSCIVPTLDIKSITAVDCSIVRLKKEILPKFFVYYTLTDKYNLEIQKHVTGAVRKRISRKNLGSVMCVIPPLAEQQRIVSELDCLNGIIEKQKEQLKQLEELAQSIFYDMFGDPVENEKGWNKKKYKEFGSIISGYAFKSGSFVEKGIPVLKIGNINSGQLNLENVCYYTEDKSLIKYEVYPNDMVISLTGTVGKDDYGNVCVLPNTCLKYYLNQRNAKLVTDGNCEILFLKFLFKDTKVKNELTKNSRGVRQANISNKDIYDLSLILPPLSLQQTFASKIEAIEHQKELIKQSLAETENLFNSRMDYYFE